LAGGQSVATNHAEKILFGESWSQSGAENQPKNHEKICEAKMYHGDGFKREHLASDLPTAVQKRLWKHGFM
jgi:hypothetical protein